MSNIGRDIIYSAKLYTVVGEETGKRGKTVLIVRMADGMERKIENNAMVQFKDVPQFAPATGMVDLRGAKDHYGDVRRMSARW